LEENFDRFNYAIHKEKEMADFRRCILALAVVALLATAASAQSIQPFSCNASAAVPPFLRSEGLTELTGDIVLTCTGSGPSGFANFTVFLGNTTVTSRILDSTTLDSEALLLIDEPGPTAGSPLSTSVPYVTTKGAAGQNVFQGTIVGNQVTFLGVPVTPPGTVGNRIYRITNIRANASAVGTGASGTPGQVTAFISITGPTSVPVNNAQQTVGFVQRGMAFSVVRTNDVTTTINAARRTFSQCSDIAKDTPRGVLRYAEQFATAFKASGRLGTTTQNIPGQIYNTESGLIPTLSTAPSTPLIVGPVTALNPSPSAAGQADFATRLRAVFNNIPTGIRVYVSTRNIVNDLPYDQLKTPVAATVPNALLVASETGPFLAVAPIADNFKNNGGTKNTTVAELTVSAGSATAVWEVTGVPNVLANDNLDFFYYFQSTASPSTNSPAAGVTGTVNGNFAPAPPAISATDGAKASATLPIPRFADTSAATNVITVVVCRTNLLFPFVTNQAGFDTGMAIANTTKDPFGTDAQAGTCTLNFYGDNAPAPVTTASVASGTVYTALAQTVAPNFQGYMIARCAFQFAHGFAFISDVGARNLAMGYLALVIPDQTDGSRGELAITLDAGTGELLGQ
jgi:hypothetical protein